MHSKALLSCFGLALLGALLVPQARAQTSGKVALVGALPSTAPSLTPSIVASAVPSCSAEEEAPVVPVFLGDVCAAEEVAAQQQTQNADSPRSCSALGSSASSPSIRQAMEGIELGRLLSMPPGAEKADTCRKLEAIDRMVGGKPVDVPIHDQRGRPWRVRFFFGNTKTYYLPVKARVQTSRLDLTIRGLQAHERGSRDFFTPWQRPLEDAFRWIDEPTNSFKISVVRDRDEFFLSIFHPKFVFVEGDQEFTGRHNNEHVHVQGTADGNKVDGWMPLKGKFDENNRFIPGNVYFVSWENSHMLLQPEVGYSRNFDLAKCRGKPILTYNQGISAGVYIGIRNASYNVYNERWQYDAVQDEKALHVMGASLTESSRVSLHNRADNVGVFVEHKFSYGRMKYGFLDGKAEHDVIYNGFTVGAQVGLFRSKNRINSK